MDRLRGILVFLKVVETCNLSEAARALGVTTAAVSVSMQRLEQKLGVRLLERTTRHVAPTFEGLDLYKRCKQIIADLEEAEVSVGRSGGQPKGKLRIAVPSGIGRIWLIPRLTEFVSLYPLVSLEIITNDFLTPASREDLDAVIQVGELPSSRIIARKLASVDRVVCGSPQYLARCGRPQTPLDLTDHVCLSYRRPRNGQILKWLFNLDDASDPITPSEALVFNNGEALVAAAVGGLGLAQVANYYARPELNSGRLVEVLSDHRTHAHDIYVTYKQGKQLPRRLRVFIDFLIKLFEYAP